MEYAAVLFKREFIISSLITGLNPCANPQAIKLPHCSDFQIVTLAIYYINAIRSLQANNRHERNRKAYRQ